MIRGSGSMGNQSGEGHAGSVKTLIEGVLFPTLLEENPIDIYFSN